MKIHYLLFLAIGSIIVSCSSPKDLNDSERKQIITQLQEKYEKAVPEKDLRIILEQYEDDAIYMPMEGSILKGNKHCLDFYF